ncbi:ABC-type dipeptide/oligopeptide/nickel transport system permease subunit [Tumebacillus sp. BK434]|uniref:ABC transporter permease n=1 Tax=Tumebacillus sp. BK434 TaxID=2512169 RepID=UPI00104390E6|nr:ABC transporter permease subunit [Tumebacillus sp. BK434]TCP57649.1 ABC-type dipeptide/oligopeptide/nickel transport system permease subunit [Tumebacillus sp. BK434]
MSTFKHTLQYRLAWIFLILLVVVCVYGGYLTPHPLQGNNPVLLEYSAQHGPPPYPPSSVFWLGTDHRGNDLFSLLLNGAKYTLGFGLLICVIRLLIGVPLGLLTGALGKGKLWVTMLSSATTSIPGLLFIYPTIYGFRDHLDKFYFLIFLSGLMVLIGVFPLALQFAQRVEALQQNLYIAASQTIGASKFRIITRHHLPHLWPELGYAFLVELVQIYFLIAQLAIVGIFIGADAANSSEGGGSWVIATSSSGEWGALIASGFRHIMHFPWLILAPISFLAVSVLILSYFLKQIQKRLSKPYLYQGGSPTLTKSQLAIVCGSLAVACVSLYLFLSDKDSNPPSDTPVVSTPEQNGTGHVLTNQEIMLKQSGPAIQDTADKFMTYMSEGKWDYAQTYLDPNSQNGTSSKDLPPAPFDKWMELFSKQNYKFGGVSDLKIVSKDNEVPIFEATLSITDGSNNRQEWKIRLNHMQRVTSGTNE